MEQSPIHKDLIAHCIEFMSNKTDVCSLLKVKGVKYPSKPSYKKLADVYEANSNAISIDDIRNVFREKWHPCNMDLHISHLKSGLLKGHSWHGARPSMLHLSIQEKVRDCCDGRLSLEEFLSLGSDVIKHEYFMVASHDICETSIIQSFPSVIPPIGDKSVTDFIFNDIPYDLKITTHPDAWKPIAGKMTQEDKDFNHVPTKHKPEMQERMIACPEGQSLYKGYSDAWKKCPWNEPSCTIKENHGGVNVHPKLPRVLTAREMARLQSFPDDFIFEGPKNKQLVQIGNAVPPLLGKAIGLAVRYSNGDL